MLQSLQNTNVAAEGNATRYEQMFCFLFLSAGRFTYIQPAASKAAESKPCTTTENCPQDAELIKKKKVAPKKLDLHFPSYVLDTTNQPVTEARQQSG